ncbi:hypothetical protein BMETH_393_1 [methanotrophic bacterial endosymbiont of Bathymodiolus sp.]|nr:hypothetical protein BMETH_393_1 [methanotrophic bacterial endosymbiont of Bathymodiolus sp.]
MRQTDGISKHSIAHYDVKLAWFYEFKGLPADPFTLEQLQHFITVYSGPKYLDQYLRSDLAQNIG